MSIGILGMHGEQPPLTTIYFSGETVSHPGDYRMVCDHAAGKKHPLKHGEVFKPCPQCKKGTVGWIQVPPVYSSPSPVPEDGFYRTTCADLVTQKLNKNDKFPVCPQCGQGGWVQI